MKRELLKGSGGLWHVGLSLFAELDLKRLPGEFEVPVEVFAADPAVLEEFKEISESFLVDEIELY